MGGMGLTTSSDKGSYVEGRGRGARGVTKAGHLSREELCNELKT